MEKIKNALAKAWASVVSTVKNVWWGITHPRSMWNKLSDRMSLLGIFLRDWYNAKFARAATDWAGVGVIVGMFWFLYMMAFPIETMLVTMGLLLLGFIWNYGSMADYYKNVWKPRIDKLAESGKDILTMRREAQLAQARSELDRNFINFERAHEKAAVTAERAASVGAQINEHKRVLVQADARSESDLLDAPAVVVL